MKFYYKKLIIFLLLFILINADNLKESIFLNILEIKKLNQFKEKRSKKENIPNEGIYTMLLIFAPVYIYCIYYLLQNFFDKLNDIVISIIIKIFNIIKFIFTFKWIKRKEHLKKD